MAAEDNLSISQLEALLAKSQAERKQRSAVRKANRKAELPVTPSDWTKEHHEDTGVTYHVHGPSGVKVWNTYRTVAHKWEILGEGSGVHGEIFRTAQEAKHRVETNHQERQARE
jgi:hypothetical protein